VGVWLPERGDLSVTGAATAILDVKIKVFPHTFGFNTNYQVALTRGKLVFCKHTDAQQAETTTAPFFWAHHEARLCG